MKKQRERRIEKQQCVIDEKICAEGVDSKNNALEPILYQTDKVAIKTPVQSKVRAQTEKRPCHSVRYDGNGHTMAKSKVRQRCKKEGCQLKTYRMCIKCGVHLCASERNCFENFHKI